MVSIRRRGRRHPGAPARPRPRRVGVPAGIVARAPAPTNSAIAAGIADRIAAGIADRIAVCLGRSAISPRTRAPLCPTCSPAPARADQLSAAELRAGPARVEAVVASTAPTVVAVAGITAYRLAYREPRARAGRQDRRIGTAAVYVVPNPSGLNAHETVASLARAYAAAAVAAGIDTAVRKFR